MDRNFGVEIELKGIDRQSAVTSLIANGINIQDAGYTHTTTPHWKAVTDGSLGGGGFEIVSPVLNGEAGLAEVKKVARLLEALGATVDQACGLHVHIDANGLTVDTVKKIVERYARHEEAIDTFMPPSRRSDSNRYCHTLRSGCATDIIRSTASDTSRLASYQPGRYYKVNLQSLRLHGTVEFRQHSGSVDGIKVANWIRFCLAFVQRSAELAASAPVPQGLLREPLPPTRLRRDGTAYRTVAVQPRHNSDKYRVAVAIRQGMTISQIGAEMLRTPAWVMFQVSAMNRDYICEFKLVGPRSLGSDRKYQVVRWFGMSEPRPVEVVDPQTGEVTMISEREAELRRAEAEAGRTDTSPFSGMDDDLVSYYTDRAAKFAARR